MLYDTRWDARTKDPFTLESFIAWLEQQPPEREYAWSATIGCLACQYYQSVGIRRPWSQMPKDYEKAFGSEANYVDICRPLPNTFGAALERARKLAKCS